MTSLQLTPSKTAVLVLDVQPSIMQVVTGSQEKLPTILNLIDSATSAGCLGAYVRVAFTQEQWAALGPNVKNLYKMKMMMGGDQLPPRFQVDGPESQLHSDVEARIRKGHDISVVKCRFGPFTTTTLLVDLQSRKIDTLLIAGFKTSGAVLSSVRAAADHDFKVVVVSDAVHDADEEINRVLLEKVIAEQADVVTFSQVKEALQMAASHS